MAAEGDSGTANATFTVSLGGPSGRPISVDFATVNGTAIAPGDYAAASGTLNFAAGETTETVTVLVNGDTLDEVERELCRQPLERVERDDRRPPGHRHDR